MRLRRLFPLAILAAAAACASLPGSAPDSHYVIRHFDTPEGQRDPDLTETGRQRASRLASWFGSVSPAAIYVSDYKRTRQSAGPLAQRLGLTPIVYDPADTAGLVARVRAGPSPALIVGHSNTVPDIVEQLGGSRPAALVHEDFGDIWRIAADGATVRERIEPR